MLFYTSSVLILISANVAYSAEKTTAVISLKKNGICFPRDIIIGLGKPLEIIFHVHNGSASVNKCYTNNKKEVSKPTTRSNKMVAFVEFENITLVMGQRIVCSLALQTGEKKTCSIALRYRNYNDVLLMINGKEIMTRPLELFNLYDWHTYYIASDGDRLHITCSSRRLEMLNHNSKLKLDYDIADSFDVSTRYATNISLRSQHNITVTSLNFTIHTSNKSSQVICESYGYRTIVMFRIRDQPKETTEIGRDQSLPMSPRYVSFKEPHFDATTEKFVRYNDPEEVFSMAEDGNKSFWLLAIIACTLVAGVVVVVICIIRLRRKRKQDQNTQIIYENIPLYDPLTPSSNHDQGSKKYPVKISKLNPNSDSGGFVNNTIQLTASDTIPISEQDGYISMDGKRTALPKLDPLSEISSFVPINRIQQILSESEGLGNDGYISMNGPRTLKPNPFSEPNPTTSTKPNPISEDDSYTTMNGLQKCESNPISIQNGYVTMKSSQLSETAPTSISEYQRYVNIVGEHAVPAESQYILKPNEYANVNLTQRRSTTLTSVSDCDGCILDTFALSSGNAVPSELIYDVVYDHMQ